MFQVFCPVSSRRRRVIRSFAGETTDKLFDGLTTTKWCANNDFPTPGSPSTYRTVVMRLATDTTEITGYNLCTANDVPARDPVNWTLEASTNGTTWTQVDARTNVVPPTARYTWYNGGTAFPLIGRSVADGPSDIIPDSSTVEVGAGATLSVFNGTDAIGALRVDLTGAGTITQLTAKEGGTLYLVNISGAPSTWTIPLIIGTVTNPDVFKSWTVYADGAPLAGYSRSRTDAADLTLSGLIRKGHLPDCSEFDRGRGHGRRLRRHSVPRRPVHESPQSQTHYVARQVGNLLHTQN
jgi:hypothetical protein